MKQLFYKRYHLLFVLIFSSLWFGSCNVPKEQAEETTETMVANKADKYATESKVLGYEKWKDMSVEERWHALSPARRNHLRENPDAMPYFKKMIAAFPEMEDVPAQPTSNKNYTNLYGNKVTPKTTEEWWNSFSEQRKKFMRENPELFPDFQPFFDNENE